MRLPKRQRGMTFIGWVIVVLLIAFFVTIALKVGPIYLEDYKIKQILSSFDEVEGLRDMSKNEITRKLWQKFYTNSVSAVKITKAQSQTDCEKKNEYYKVVKKDTKLTIDIHYQAKEKLFGNLSVVVDFTHHFEAIFH